MDYVFIFAKRVMCSVQFVCLPLHVSACYRPWAKKQGADPGALKDLKESVHLNYKKHVMLQTFSGISPCR